MTSHSCCCSVCKSHLCNPMDCSTISHSRYQKLLAHDQIWGLMDNTEIPTALKIKHNLSGSTSRNLACLPPTSPQLLLSVSPWPTPPLFFQPRLRPPGTPCCSACRWTTVPSSNKVQRNHEGLKITVCVNNWGRLWTTRYKKIQNTLPLLKSQEQNQGVGS